ncbi:thioesterase thiol ester dehydrase-isomerase [Pisolithus tinctorius]|uniref:HotDog ACOT-type domain-containing protein n=1 Tax=Pisolithus tinctorius Marx 270 TaxID=870435 RepID=A0A0C3ITL0_PISTI|nr:thioesterase thiol ester dehydrase-isomerase [Pisolithus tinctorius]KIO00233.1 hypothetical protein M404DRAFT_16382 [Pisolithus tinctorius Marx 270]
MPCDISSPCKLQDARTTEAKAASETRDIEAMDRLLRVANRPSFASSPDLFEQYTNASGGLRTGMLMEHLDSLAGSIPYKHMLGPSVEILGRVQERGFYIVTASVERWDILASLYPVRDTRLGGQEIYTGKSFMEVAVKMEALDPDGGGETLMLGRFSMFCRSARAYKAHPVISLIIRTPEEEAHYEIDESWKDRRKYAALRALSCVPPNSAEAAELHATYLKCGQEENSLVRSDRLGFANACFFKRSHVTFHSLNGISFMQPVPMGSILRLRSQIPRTTTVHVRVVASVVNVQAGHEETANDIRFTWAWDDGKSTSRIIVPKTYQEVMLWLEG